VERGEKSFRQGLKNDRFKFDNPLFRFYRAGLLAPDEILEDCGRITVSCFWWVYYLDIGGDVDLLGSRGRLPG